MKAAWLVSVLTSVLVVACTGVLTLPALAATGATDDLPPGVMRGPLLHEHSFQAPLVSDWWEEGVPHYMIGGSTVANERFLRLTANNLDDSGFAFNTAPLDHDSWEARVKLSVRPPPPALQTNNDLSIKYQGGEGLALWYLDRAIGDDHQHVAKYSKPISAEVAVELKDMENPWRLMDALLNVEEKDDLYEGIAEEDLTEAERRDHQEAQERKAEKRKKREELFRRIFKRGTSVDDSDFEPRIMGVKHSDFTQGFAVVLDSVGNDELAHLAEHHTKGDAVEHHHHQPTISLLFNLPNHTSDSGKAIVNNFRPGQESFRSMPKLLQCTYDFRQEPSKSYLAGQAAAVAGDKEAKALSAPEEPIELIVRYYKKKLSVVIRREDVSKRTILRAANTQLAEHDQQVEVQRTYRDTLCGELFPVTIPPKYHFGLSASTGRRKQKERLQEEDLFQRKRSGTVMHVDVHDVYAFELRELGTDPKSMGYSKSVPIEHFDYNQDKREREHYSRQIPVEPG